MQKKHERKTKKAVLLNGFLLIGVEGFEPPAPWSQTTYSTKLSHTPATNNIYYMHEWVFCQQVFLKKFDFFTFLFQQNNFYNRPVAFTGFTCTTQCFTSGKFSSIRLCTSTAISCALRSDKDSSAPISTSA